MNKHITRTAYDNLDKYMKELKLVLKETDPAVTGEIQFWAACMEGVLNYLKEGLDNE